MILFAKAVLATFYLVRILLFEEKTSHVGPFPSKEEKVYVESSYHTQSVTLFDRVRRLFPPSPYVVTSDGLWEVDDIKMERWTCPKCLSAWMALVVTAFIVLFVDQPKGLKDLFEKVLFGVGVAGASTVLNQWVERSEIPDGMWVWDEGAENPDSDYS